LDDFSCETDLEKFWKSVLMASMLSLRDPPLPPKVAPISIPPDFYNKNEHHCGTIISNQAYLLLQDLIHFIVIGR